MAVEQLVSYEDNQHQRIARDPSSRLQYKGWTLTCEYWLDSIANAQQQQQQQQWAIAERNLRISSHLENMLTRQQIFWLVRRIQLCTRQSHVLLDKWISSFSRQNTIWSVQPIQGLTHQHQSGYFIGSTGSPVNENPTGSKDPMTAVKAEPGFIYWATDVPVRENSTFQRCSNIPVKGVRLGHRVKIFTSKANLTGSKDPRTNPSPANRSI